MKIYKIQLNSSINIDNINLAIGNFDGVHIGHQKIIERLVHQSNEMHINSTIMSFLPHPRQFFSGKNDNFKILSEDLKIKLLKQIGVNHYFVLNFDQSIASLTPKEFIEIMSKKVHV